MENASDRSSSPLSNDDSSFDDKSLVALRFIASSKVPFDDLILSPGAQFTKDLMIIVGLIASLS